MGKKSMYRRSDDEVRSQQKTNKNKKRAAEKNESVYHLILPLNLGLHMTGFGTYITGKRKIPILIYICTYIRGGYSFNDI